MRVRRIGERSTDDQHLLVERNVTYELIREAVAALTGLLGGTVALWLWCR